MSEEYTLKCHEMAKELMQEFRMVEYVSRRYRAADDKIREYAKYYQQAYELFSTVSRSQPSE